MPIDYVISQTKNIDITDNHGVTPLHLAVTCGELYSKKLLDAGADPAAPTDEGLTPLHLASRARESSTVGLLLDALRARSQETSGFTSTSPKVGPLSSRTGTSSPKPVMGVNAKACNGKNEITPLFYACRSGRPETVELLLEAGADVNIRRIFQACLEFEEEDHLWWIPDQPADGHRTQDTIALSLNGTCRRYIIPSDDLDENEMTRLEEILDMLVQYGADYSQLDSSKRHDGPIELAVEYNRDYTAACLRDIVDRYQLKSASEKHEGEITRFSQLMQQSLSKASIKTLKDLNVVNHGKSNQELFCRFLVRREYNLVEELAHLGATFLPIHGQDEVCNLSILIKGGFTSLVEKIGSLEAASRLENGDWHAFGDKIQPGLSFANKDFSDPDNMGSNPMPFLLNAVLRELPNMNVVRLLVERFKVDVNEIYYGQEYVDGGYRLVPVESALQYVARGSSWWQVHQALPYLLKAGANLEIRNSRGQTPIQLALTGDGDWPGPFNSDAVRILVEAGADVNVVDDLGRCCLASAKHDASLIKLLKLHGAAVTPDAIFAAIESNNVDGLQELLSGGGDANIRHTKSTEKQTHDSKNRGNRTRMANGLEPHEEFPLYRAAMALRVTYKRNSQDLQEFKTRLRLVQVLLDHGANPFAKFWIQDQSFKRESGKSKPTATCNMPLPRAREGYEECTVFHKLLLEGMAVDNLLRVPDLDVDHRDAEGRTLLLAACQGHNGPDYILDSHEENADGTMRISIFHQLISLGADLTAQDNCGRNILHLMIGGSHGNEFNRFENSFTDALENAPDLINQPDNDGVTPLHYAITRAVNRGNPHIAELLLSAGANALAVNKDGDSTLHILAGNLDNMALCVLFKDLVERGVDINARNAEGESSLFVFCNRIRKKVSLPSMFDDVNKQGVSDQDVVSMLEKLGADFLARDEKGRGLLHIAASRDVQRFKQLMDMGLDVMLEDNTHQTPIDVAAACENEEVLALFEKKDEGRLV